MRTYIDPPVPDEQLTEILSRGDGRMLDIARPHDGEQEYLLDWMFGTLLSWEARDNVEVPIRPDEILQMFGRAGRRRIRAAPALRPRSACAAPAKGPADRRLRGVWQSQTT